MASSDYIPVPEQTEAVCAACNSLDIQWYLSRSLENSIDYFQIQYKPNGTKKWGIGQTDGKETSFTICSLQPDTEYEIRVRAIYDGEEGTFCNKIITKTKPSFAHKMKRGLIPKWHDPDCNIHVYQIPVREIDKIENIKTRICNVGGKLQLYENTSKTILLVGASGAGKTLMLEAFVNYIFGVSYEDDFRFSMASLEHEERIKLSDQSISQTEWITKYQIARRKSNSKLFFDLNIIDTPGFGDTRGIQKDEEITRNIAGFFNNKHYIPCINAVAFVVQAGLARLTDAQRYVFQSILSLFGHDIQEKIFILCTFADEGTPCVLSALGSEKIPVKHVYKFNNDCLLRKSPACNHNWQMGTESLEKFFTILHHTESQSLVLTKQVLANRQHLEVTVQGLQPRISKGIDQLESLQQEIDNLKFHESDIEKNKNYTYAVDVPYTIQTKQPFHCTNCPKCKVSCHTHCSRLPGNWLCYAMKSGKCTVCPDKCSSGEHVLEQYMYRTETRKETKTYSNMKKDFEEAKKRALTSEDMIREWKNEIKQTLKEIGGMMQTINDCTRELEKIALKESPLSNSKFFDFLIEAEKTKTGAKHNSIVLMDLRKNAELMQACTGDNFRGFENVNADELLEKRAASNKKQETNVFKGFIQNVKKVLHLETDNVPIPCQNPTLS